MQTYFGFSWILGCLAFGFIVILKPRGCQITKLYLCIFSLIICGFCCFLADFVQGVSHWFYISISPWDFLLKFLSLPYYSALEGVLGVQRRWLGEGAIVFLLGLLCFFCQDGMAFKKPTKIIKIQWKVTVFRIFSEFVHFWLENSGPNQLDELKRIILLLLTPMSSLEEE